jgi:hypothetical protein
MKKALNIGIFILFAYLIFLKLFLNSIDHKDAYHINEIDEFLENIEHEYHFVKDSEVVEHYGEIIIKIYYAGHPDLVFDESIYDDIRNEFNRLELRQKILDEEQKQFVSLKVEFIDNVSFSTHHIVIDIQSD